mmetsp:Transcript_24169/g.60196  ORF Transcript_24169/g.60196 Transcript_24169/m.60196 type:complete len:97 (-) Transcript_24169:151-441(-)
MNPTLKISILLAVLAALCAAQTTCPCSANTRPSCSGIVQIAPGSCVTVTNACSGCACDVEGELVCEVVEAQVLAFTGVGDNLCALTTAPVPSCPAP